jgi:hypothetical protein
VPQLQEQTWARFTEVGCDEWANNALKENLFF